MGLCSSSETTDDTRSRTGSATVMDEENIVTAEAVKQNEELRKKDHVRRASLLKHGDLRTPSGTPIPIPEHVQGALDVTARTSSMASRTMQKMIHTQSSAEVTIDASYEMTGGKVLGTGVTGAVRIVVNKKTGKAYAHKLLRVSRVKGTRKRNQMRLEVDILKTLDHPNIVKIHEVFEYPNGDLSLFMELLHGDELFERLLQEKPHYRFVEEDVRRISYKMFQSVNYLHVNRLVHRDIKLENFMFTSNDVDGDLKLLDFGFSRTYLQGENIKYVAGTPYTMSPEVFKRKAGPPSDVWAVAVCMYVLLYGRRPFEGTNRYQIEEKVMNGTFEWREDMKGYLVSDVVKDLITKCLVLDPDKRLTADEALRHPFFTDPIDINTTTSATTTDTATTDANHPTDGPRKIKMLTRPKASAKEVNDVIDHLWAFSELGKLRKVVLLAVSQSLTAKEIAGLNVVFEELDLTKDGTIGFVELTHAVQKYSAKNNRHVNIPKDSLQKLFDDLDQDNSGFIKYSEFIAACLEQNEAYSDGVLADAFSRMDLDNSGFITRQNLNELMRSASDDLSDEQLTETVDRMLSEGDINHDGQISLEELKQVMRSPATRQGKYGRHESSSSVESVTYEDIANRREKDAGLIASLVEVFVEEKND